MERQHPLIPWVVGPLVAGIVVMTNDIVPWIAVAIGGVAAVSTSILIQFIAAQRVARLESQLADSVDLMVSTLRAGGGLTDALSSAAQEAGRPLRGYLHELIERIRLGERPESVLTSLEERVPLESLRLFTFTLGAHWQGGGSLATTLSNVGRTIRDRFEVARRVRGQAVETEVSVVGVMVVTYSLALLMWNNYPDRVELFATSELGSMFIGFTIVMQGFGIFWISRVTRIEV